MSDTPCLRNINLSVPRGSFVALAGPPPSGKSILLKLLPGETFLVSETVSLSSTDIAYADHKPWLANISLKDNMVGWDGRFADEKRCEDAYTSCDLSEDFGNYVHAAGVTVGGRGANLSGGRKQRVVSTDL